MNNLTFENRRFVAALATAIALQSTPAAALQDGETVEGIDAASDVIFAKGNEVATITASGPISRSTGAGNSDKGPAHEFQINTIDGATIGEFAFTWNSSSVDDRTVADGATRVHFKKKTSSLKFAFPLANENDTSFFDFAKIGNDAQASFDIVFYSDKRTLGKPLQDSLASRVSTCINQAGNAWLNDQAAVVPAGSSKQAQIEAAKSQYRAQSGATYSSRLLGLKASEFKAVLLRECETSADGPIGNLDDILDRFPPDQTFNDPQAATYRLQDFEPRSTTFWGLSGKAGYEQFDLLRPADFRIDTTDRLGFEIEGFAGFIQGNGDFTARLAASYARGYEAGEEQEICQPGTDGAETCLSAPVDEPDKKESFFVKAEARIILARDKNGAAQVALAPLVSYDTDESEFLVDVPLYLIQSENKGLDAGVRVGYGSKDDEVVFGFFVGAPLNNLF